MRTVVLAHSLFSAYPASAHTATLNKPVWWNPAYSWGGDILFTLADNELTVSRADSQAGVKQGLVVHFQRLQFVEMLI